VSVGNGVFVAVGVAVRVGVGVEVAVDVRVGNAVGGSLVEIAANDSSDGNVAENASCVPLFD
jgi:hypothetical protein